MNVMLHKYNNDPLLYYYSFIEDGFLLKSIYNAIILVYVVNKHFKNQLTILCKMG